MLRRGELRRVWRIRSSLVCAGWSYTVTEGTTVRAGIAPTLSEAMALYDRFLGEIEVAVVQGWTE